MPILQGAFDDAKKHYKRHGILGFVPPELRESASRVPQALRMGLDYVGPAADMQDMKNYSGATMDELRAGNYGPALANLGMTGAALAMTALPGNVGAADDLSKALTKRGVRGDNLLNAQDMIQELKGVGADVSDDGFVTVYHRTARDNLEKILSSGEMTAKEPDIFFSTSKGSEYGAGFGDDYVAVRVPVEELRLDDIFPGRDASVSIRAKGPIGTPRRVEIVGSSLDDLPMDTASRMKRAEEMGFDTSEPLYSGFVPIDDVEQLEPGTWFSDVPEIASEYTEGYGKPGEGFVATAFARGNMANLEDPKIQNELFNRLRDDIPGGLSWADDEEAISWARELGFEPETAQEARDLVDWQALEGHLTGGRLWDAEGLGNRRFEGYVLDELDSMGFDGVRLPDSTFGRPNTSVVVFHPKNIRSRFAKFDPAKKDSADLLASIGGAGLLGLGLTQRENANTE